MRRPRLRAEPIKTGCETRLSHCGHSLIPSKAPVNNCRWHELDDSTQLPEKDEAVEACFNIFC